MGTKIVLECVMNGKIFKRGTKFTLESKLNTDNDSYFNVPQSASFPPPASGNWSLNHAKIMVESIKRHIDRLNVNGNTVFHTQLKNVKTDGQGNTSSNNGNNDINSSSNSSSGSARYGKCSLSSGTRKSSDGKTTIDNADRGGPYRYTWCWA